jgi:hypothetical protein
MAALTAITPTNVGAVSTGAGVAASDTISQEILGSKGAVLEIINGSGSSDTITISDHGQTPSQNPLASNAITGLTVASASQKAFVIRPQQVNPATGLVTITHTQTTSVTYKLYSLAAF